jgi:hypothetical protein
VRLIAGGIQVDMTGRDMIGLPSRTTLATDAAWVAEGAPIPARKQAIADAIPLIRPRKLAVLVALVPAPPTPRQPSLKLRRSNGIWGDLP